MPHILHPRTTWRGYGNKKNKKSSNYRDAPQQLMTGRCTRCLRQADKAPAGKKNNTTTNSSATELPRQRMPGEYLSASSNPAAGPISNAAHR
eukprot:CAMPEP_0179062216 /NCGR_PEP_ID=MMETSP0796-20121207/26817_1 /TAXON_ID=73915 /ORGANISM="Pyrodinium bahamense, Strain pbaha01" /LENGTH=91 /DNA_ID=CAMNT_0020759123 /DNA_START=120 /DNA_END=393 /DNA_ORIENTATION=-